MTGAGEELVRADRAEAAFPSITEWLAMREPAASAGEHVQRLLHFHILQRQRKR